ncbi:hypothetical protein EUX98_g3664 [Antrodiella citrinella]|uniref:Uncharacterized protein n=1 Tax=Antrodiella citrinella TaxID=2447956 RepID=A0A4V3XIU1_9APHY|nr:hypothetical protein EUX98_g3664 [Antrodiella citrinella]
MPNFVYSSANVGATLSAVSSRSSSQEQEGGKERERRKRRPTLKNTGKRSIEVPPPLILHLTAPSSRHYSLPYTPTSSASSSNSCSSSSTLTPGRTPSGTGALTPVTPVTPVSPTPTESRRKRMAKLTRTLGERIPPGLVFASRSRKASSASLRPAPSTATHDTVPPLPPRKDSLHPKSAGKAGRRRSMSVDFANVGVATHATYPPPTAPQPVVEGVGDEQLGGVVG